MACSNRFVFLFLGFFSTGCFTQSYLGKDELPPDNRSVVFHLRDSTRVSSPSGKHCRIEEGYEVIGKLSTERGDNDEFEGVILDEDVAGITMDQYNVTGTVALIAGVAIVFLLIQTRWGHDL